MRAGRRWLPCLLTFTKENDMRSLVLWLFGVPITLIILLNIFGVL
jgi:hypothetical protein